MEFIKHGGFILRISEISYIKKVTEGTIKSIVVTMRDRNTFQMEYDDEYDFESSFDLICLTTDSHVKGYQEWKSSFIEYLQALNKQCWDLNDRLVGLTKEISMFRKKIKVIEMKEETK